MSGRRVFSPGPDSRWQPEPYYRADRWDHDGIYATAGSFLGGRAFDPVEWKIPPATLSNIDPVHLLVMQLAAEALENAGVQREEFPRERTSIIFASSGGELGMRYAFQTLSREYVSKLECLDDEKKRCVLDEWNRQLPRWTEDSFAGYLANVLTGRIANRFGLGGTSFVVDAACASSLAALQAGVQQLQLRTADAVVVGAADASNHPFCYMSFARSQALSPQGASRPFDQAADGIVLGEGMAVLVLRRLDDALESEQPIHAVIRSVGGSSDGCGRSVTAPDLAGQRRCLESAYFLAECKPETIALIEAHGTGTALGDGVELNSLLEWLGPNAAPKSVALGSIKSQIGHCKTAAGMLGMAKAILALEAGVLPPTGKVDQPRAPLASPDCPLYLNTEPRPWWSHSDHPRRAGVSAFGFGGSNFHVVLEESPRAPSIEQPWAIRPAEIFVCSRDSRIDLRNSLSEFLECTRDLELTDLTTCAGAFYNNELLQTATPQVRMARLAIVATTAAELRERLETALRQLERLPDGQDWNQDGLFLSLKPAVDPRQVCFVYPGQGTQTVGMFRDLIIADRRVQPFVEAFDEIFRKHHPGGFRLVDLIWPPPDGADEAGTRQSRLNDTSQAQPALGAVEAALTEWLKPFGIIPAATAGHSYGEFAALWAAGVLNLDDFARLSVTRGALCAAAGKANPGGMLAVELSADRLRPLLEVSGLEVVIANVNAPEQTVCAGPIAACEKFQKQLHEQGVAARRLSVSCAFHTAAMGCATGDWSRLLADISFQTPNLPVYSNTTGQRHATEPHALRHTLGQHLHSPVDFVGEVRTMLADGFRVFIEIGPGSVLSSLIRRIAAEEPATVLNFGSAGSESLLAAVQLLGRCFALGLPVNLAPWFRGRVSSMTMGGLMEQAQQRMRTQEKCWHVSPMGVTPPQRKPPRTEPPAAAFSRSVPPSSQPDPIVAVSNGHVRREEAPNPKVPQLLPRPIVQSSPIRPFETTIIPKVTEPVTHYQSGHDDDRPWNQVLNLAHRWFELQSQQQTVADRIFRLQELMLTGQLPAADPGWTRHGKPDAPVRSPMPSPLGEPHGSSNGHARVPSASPPAPVAGVPMDFNFGLTPSTAGTARPPAAVTQKSPEIPSRPAIATSLKSESGAPPSVAEFRDHLLTVVSDRTGYDREILDETLPLDAGLGIDSIKVVEILSRMQDFYLQVRLEGASDESVLQEFVNLKTLSDIIGGYERARQRFLEHRGSTAEEIKSPTSSVALEQYAVVAESAEPSPGDPRKN